MRRQYEEKIKGLMPAELQKELEDTITSLKAQVSGLTNVLTSTREFFPHASLSMAYFCSLWPKRIISNPSSINGEQNALMMTASSRSKLFPLVFL